MKYIEHEFDGVTRRLSFTAGALFKVYEKFGYMTDIVAGLKLSAGGAEDKGPDRIEGWNNVCWLYALMAEQGNLQRKALYMDAQPIITYEQLRTQASPADMLSLKQAVYDALALGFKRDNAPTPDEEVDEVLMEIEEREKKKLALAAFSFLSSLRQRVLSTSGRETH